MAAQIIQHGRDHGVPGYVKWREFCGLPAVQTFEQLSDVMTGPTIATLKSIYRNVSDIDLFTGGLAETPGTGAVVGRTFGCLIGRQFHYLRRGDRYWYENELPPSSFTKGTQHPSNKEQTSFFSFWVGINLDSALEKVVRHLSFHSSPIDIDILKRKVFPLLLFSQSSGAILNLEKRQRKKGQLVNKIPF